MEAKILRQLDPKEIKLIPTFFLVSVAQAILFNDRSTSNKGEAAILNRFEIDGDNEASARATALRVITI